MNTAPTRRATAPNLSTWLTGVEAGVPDALCPLKFRVHKEKDNMRWTMTKTRVTLLESLGFYMSTTCCRWYNSDQKLRLSYRRPARCKKARSMSCTLHFLHNLSCDVCNSHSGCLSLGSWVIHQKTILTSKREWRKVDIKLQNSSSECYLYLQVAQSKVAIMWCLAKTDIWKQLLAHERLMSCVVDTDVLVSKKDAVWPFCQWLFRGKHITL